MSTSLIFTLLAVAPFGCKDQGPAVIVMPPDTGVAGDSGPNGTDSGTSGDTDAVPEPDSGDPSDSGDIDPTKSQVDELAAHLHTEITSLVYVSWEQLAPATAWVEYSFEGGEWHTTPTSELATGPSEQLVLGVPYGTEVTFRVVNDLGAGPVASPEGTITTGPLPEGLPLPQYVSGDSSSWYAEGNYLYTSINERSGGWTSGDYWKLILDRQGRVVWASLTENSHWTIWVDTSLDGNDLMWDDASVWAFDSDLPSNVHRMKIDGTIVETYETKGLHHAWVELADGSITWGSHINSDEEYLIRLHPDGTQETIWRCSDYEYEMLGEFGNSCHSNAWFWHEETNTFLVSFPSSAGDVKDTVLHIDHTGATLNSWGALGGWSFVPATSIFDYQHGISFTPEGTLLVSTKLNEIHPNYDPRLDTLAVREYELDYETSVLREIWSFGEDQEIAGDTAGEAHRLPNGNTLHNYGSGARVREITPDGTLVWDVKWADGDSEGSGRLQGRSVFLEDLYAYAP